MSTAEKKTRVRQVFGRQRLEAGDKVYVFEMSKSGVSVCATGRGQVESSKTFPELLAFIAGIELLPCVKPKPETVEEIDAEIDEITAEGKSLAEKRDRINEAIMNCSIRLRSLGALRSEKQTGRLL